MDLETGFIASFIYFLLRFCKLIQDAFSKTLWFCFIIPGLWISAKIRVRDPKYKAPKDFEQQFWITLDCLKFSHRLVWYYLLCECTRLLWCTSKME